MHQRIDNNLFRNAYVVMMEDESVFQPAEPEELKDRSLEYYIKAGKDVGLPEDIINKMIDEVNPPDLRMVFNMLVYINKTDYPMDKLRLADLENIKHVYEEQIEKIKELRLYMEKTQLHVMEYVKNLSSNWEFDYEFHVGAWVFYPKFENKNNITFYATPYWEDNPGIVTQLAINYGKTNDERFFSILPFSPTMDPAKDAELYVNTLVPILDKIQKEYEV